ncbi:TATA element modulatory factor [Ischnura elegans]|uniref:TATA element modulatory factor n=1 Tax=Ischnura elegans TaxID=197161 RepID=UPI001ED8A977|nr:TATA element modulatory factor [Ischnura elegans]
MSWFDASGIASLATKALKEAQKTIDKALDIKDEDDQSSPSYVQVSPVEESDNFFSSWGLKSPTKPMKSSTSLESEDDGNDSGISEKVTSSGITSVMTSSLWGSFTGSFFENSRTSDVDNVGSDRVPVFSQPKRSQSNSMSEEAPVPSESGISSLYSTSDSQSQGGAERRSRRPSRNAVKVDGVVEGVDDEEVDAFSDSRVMLVVRDEEDDEQECLSITHPSEDHGEDPPQKLDECGDPKQTELGAESSQEGVVLYKLFPSKFGERSEESGITTASSSSSFKPNDGASSQSHPQEDEVDESALSPSSSSVSPHTPSSSVSSPSSAPSRDAGLVSEGGTTGGKRSSESVEVLGSCEEGCATSPEGDIGAGIIESVPVHLGPHGRTPPFGSSGFIKVHAGESVLGAKSSSGTYESVGYACPDGNRSFRLGDERGRLSAGSSLDRVAEMDVGEREKGASTSVERRAEVPSAIGKGWDCRTEGIEAVSGHGSPESVEVIPEDGDVATSPSSVEVIGGSASSTTPSISASTSTRPSSSSSSVSPTTPGGGSSSGFAILAIHDDVVESSVISKVVPDGAVVVPAVGPSNDGASQTVEKKLNVPGDDTSPESVEVIPEEVEEEEMSSSASSTTTTTAVTVLEQQRALVGPDTRPASVLVASGGSMERSSREDEAEEARTSLDSHKGKDVCDNSREKLTSSDTDELKTSSYLRTLLADAMQEKEEMAKAAGIGQDDAAEKQAKDDNLAREQSPLSSERSDLVKVGEEEMSGQTSGDEELDTTTSSDIEIISSPNGDSGSNKSESRRRGPGMASKMSSSSRQGAMVASPSPAPSTASSSSSSSSFSMVGRGMSGCQREDRQLIKLSDYPASAAIQELRESFRGEGERLHHLHHLSQRSRFPRDHHLLLEERSGATINEVEELTKRLSETSDILEARESKLIELSRSNIELQEQNMDFARKLKEAESKCMERETARCEFEGRLATLDRKLQQANGENELLRMKLKEKMEELSRRDSNDLAALLKEKEEECKELREEGEKLSKQEMNLTTIIKNLRAAQKTSEKTITSLRQRLEESENELERFKRSLGMREEVERTQVEAIHNLKMSLEAAKRESSDLLSKVDNERKALSEEKRSLEEEKEQWNERERELLAAIEFGRLETERLRETLSKVQEDHTKREEAQRMERLVLERRLVEVEARGEEVGAQASRATRPLLRQLESLQTMARQREAAWEATEKELLSKLAEAEGKAKMAAEKERSGRQRCATLSSRVSSLESQLMALRKEVETEAALSKENLEKREKEVARLEGEKMKLEGTLSDCKRSNLSLEERLSVERAAVEAEKRRNALLQDQLREHLQQKQNEQTSSQQNQIPHHHKGSPPSPRSSPALSFGHASLDESITSSTWLPLFQEDGFHDGRSMNSVFEGHAGIMNAAMTTSSSSLIESLQSQLKLRDGEVQQLQWELSRGENERSALTTEVSSLTAKVLELESALNTAKGDSGKLSDLQTKYDALLQMYGEKVEETEELRLDLEDVKEMYKTQIDQLTKKDDIS